MVSLVKLVAKGIEPLGYVTYVFENLEDEGIYKYIMCVRFPNWDHSILNIGDTGFVQYKEIRAGMDKWFDGEKMVPYNYNTVQFLKFVPKPEDTDSKYIM